MLLRFHATGSLPIGQGWNRSCNADRGLSSNPWAWRLPGVLLAAAVEIPYATASGEEVNPDTARSLGRDIARAIRRFLERPTIVP